MNPKSLISSVNHKYRCVMSLVMLSCVYCLCVFLWVPGWEGPAVETGHGLPECRDWTQLHDADRHHAVWRQQQGAESCSKTSPYDCIPLSIHTTRLYRCHHVFMSVLWAGPFLRGAFPRWDSLQSRSQRVWGWGERSSWLRFPTSLLWGVFLCFVFFRVTHIFSGP